MVVKLCVEPRRRTMEHAAVIFPRRQRDAFTLVELLVVIAIIAVLMGLAFPVFQNVQNSAKKTQAKNDLVQVVTAVNAFYTEYGKYPLPSGAAGDAVTYGGGGPSSRELFDSLRGIDRISNPRQLQFINPPDAKASTTPRGGIGPVDGQFYDPWGTPYSIRIDADYSGEVPNPYGANAGATPNLRQGVIAWSSGRDRATQSGGDKNTNPNKDDIISWQ